MIKSKFRPWWNLKFLIFDSRILKSKTERVGYMQNHQLLISCSHKGTYVRVNYVIYTKPQLSRKKKINVTINYLPKTVMIM